MTAILVSLLFSAFFSGIEIAFVSSDKLRIEIDKDKGGFSGRLISIFTRNPSQFIGTCLIGNTLALVVYGIFMAKLLEPLIVTQLPEFLNNQTIVFVLQTILATLVVLITAEFLPKSIFLINPNQMLNILSLPVWIVYVLLYPVVFIVVNFSKFIIRNILRLRFTEDQPVFGLTDLNTFIQSKIVEDKTEKVFDVDAKIFNNALEFKTVKVRECMIPRPEIMAVDITDPIEVLKKEFIKNGLSKILIYRETIDDIIGYCHSLEMFKKPKDIASILTPIIIVPETMPANELLVQFITERKSLALVVDEFGGTSGIVTMEDIIEEIFGEIEDEHDEQDLVEQVLDDHNFLISARLEIDYLNEKYGWDFPEGDYDTLGGFILSITEDFPTLNQEIIIKPFKFHIVSLEENRINLVKLTIIQDQKS